MSGNLTVTLLNTTMLLVQVSYISDFTCYHKEPGVASNGYCRFICSNMTRDALATGFRDGFVLDVSRGVNLSEVFCMIDGGQVTHFNSVTVATPPTDMQEHSTLVTSPPQTRSAWTGEDTATSLLLPACGLLCLLGAIYWIRRLQRSRSRRRREAAQGGDGAELAERIIIGEELAILVTGEAVVNVTVGTAANGTTAGTIGAPGTPGAVAIGAMAAPTRVDASTSTDDVVERGGDS
ncbi:uncharacterized protein LOC116953502 [Petromyzon marinus]|uniref:Uncharacterized protein LOC116953502 n=1 Tax=Petromyzon marinus TaxID=7757 RepID=A0AAJ7U6N8_PETMA|nr:uncharacterized protein LOC116953502 [Petromyzon marinus]